MNNNFDDQDYINDELHRNSSSSLQFNDFSAAKKKGQNADRDVYGEKQKSPKGLNGIQDDKVSKHDQADIDSINNRKGKNGDIDDSIAGKKKDNDDESDDNSSSSRKTQDSSDLDDNKKENKGSSGSDTAKDKTKDGAAQTTLEGTKKGSKLALKAQIVLWAIGIIAGLALAAYLILCLVFIWNTFMTSITTFFGIKEGELEGDTEEKYLWSDEELNKLTWPELIEKLNDDNYCKIGSGWADFKDAIYSIFNGDGFRDTCQLIRIVRGTIEEYEKKYKDYNLQMDSGLIIGTIFFGYDQQAQYYSYDDPSEEIVIPPSNHFDTLQNIVEAKDELGEPLLKKSDVLRIIKSTIFEELYPYFNFRIEHQIKKRLNGTEYEIVTGYCDQVNHQFYYNSLQKWEIFLRYNDDEQDNTNGEKRFGMSGYMKSDHTDFLSGLSFPGDTNRKILNKNILSITDDNEFLSLTGAGFVYDTNMNNSWEYTSSECNGTDYDLSEIEELLLEQCTMSDCNIEVTDTVEKAHNFYLDRGLTELIDTEIYTQYIEDPNTQELDVFESVDRNYTVNTGGTTVEIRSVDASNEAKVDYKKGFAYQQFPGFELADNDENLPTYNYDPTFTPKKIETIINEIKARKDEFNEVLYVDENGEPTRIFNGAFPAKVGKYCEYVMTETNGADGSVTMSNQQLSNIRVNLTNCAGKSIGSVNFKDYIMGVTVAEIDHYQYEDYILTQMIASISYALSRRGNENTYQKGYITMKSGSCDQNWCDIYNGCSRFKQKGYYDSTISGPSASGSYYKNPATDSELEVLNRLYDKASQYLLFDNNGNIMEAGYSASRQNEWKELAKQGFSFMEILNSEYTGSVVVDCVYPEEYYEEEGTSPSILNIPGSGEMPSISNAANRCTNYVTSSSSKGKEAANLAISWIGRSIGDCSTFVGTVYNSIGAPLKRLSDGTGRGSSYLANYYKDRCVREGNLQPGDLVFMGKKGSNKVTHVGIYVGLQDNGYMFIDTTSSNHTVRYQDYARDWGNYEIYQYSRPY